MEKIKIILIGAGNRGQAYTNRISENLADKFEVVGVADPIENRREYIKNKHNIPEKNCFNSWEDILNVPKFADVAIIGTQDEMHHAPSMKALELGYHLLLEKPVAPTEEECVDIWRQAKKYDRKVVVCHVLRYTPFYMKVKSLIENDAIGDVINISHVEGVGNTHQSHSFVRGNWCNSERSAFMLLAKCCHDIDLLQWLINKKCKRVQSFGSLQYFTEKNAPKDAPDYCIEGCPHADTCFYDAVKIYLDDKENLWFRSTATNKVEPTDDDIIDVLKNTQYGKCVFKCDNDVVDHQIVNLEFEDGSTVSHTMSAFNRGGRNTRIMGTKGEMICDFRDDEIKIYSFDTKEWTTINPRNEKSEESVVDGHGGGDTGIAMALYDYLTGAKTADEVSEIGISCMNHLLVFAAEKSRLGKCIVEIEELE